MKFTGYQYNSHVDNRHTDNCHIRQSPPEKLPPRTIATRPVTSLGHQAGWRVFWEGPKFFKLCNIVLNYVQQNFPGGAKTLPGGLRPPCAPWLWAWSPPYHLGWMRSTHPIRANKFSVHYLVGVRRGVLAALRLGSTVLRYYCFNIVQQKWVATLSPWYQLCIFLGTSDKRLMLLWIFYFLS